MFRQPPVMYRITSHIILYPYFVMNISFLVIVGKNEKMIMIAARICFAECELRAFSPLFIIGERMHMPKYAVKYQYVEEQTGKHDLSQSDFSTDFGIAFEKRSVMRSV